MLNIFKNETNSEKEEYDSLLNEYMDFKHEVRKQAKIDKDLVKENKDLKILVIEGKKMLESYKKYPKKIAQRDEKIADLLYDKDVLMKRITSLKKLQSIETETETNLIVIKYDPDLKSCLICKADFTEDDQILACPYCMYGSHKSHIEEWVKVKGNCPNCLEKI